MTEIENHIAALQAIDSESQTALSEVLSAVATFNAHIGDEVRRDVRMVSPEKLKEWLDKLVAKVRAIVEKMSDVASFTVTVGTPFTVSVSVTFAGSTGG